MGIRPPPPPNCPRPPPPSPRPSKGSTMGESAPRPPLTIPMYARGQQKAAKPKKAKLKLPIELPDGSKIRGFREDGRPIISTPMRRPGGGYQPTESPRIEDIAPPTLDTAPRPVDRVKWGSELIERELRTTDGQTIKRIEVDKAHEESVDKGLEDLRRKQARANWYGTTVKPEKGLPVEQWAKWADEVIEEDERLERVEQIMKVDRGDFALVVAVVLTAVVVVFELLGMFGG